MRELIERLKATSSQENHDAYQAELKTEHNEKIKKILTEIMDKKYINITWKDYTVESDNQDSFGKVKQWFTAYKQGSWLVLKGTQGTGKTMIKNILIKYLYGNHKIKAINTTLYGLYVEYLDSIKNGSTKRLLDKLGNAKLLVIDEIGRKESTTALKDFVFEVMDRLYLNGGSAILITNLESVKEYIDISRLNEVGLSVTFSGKDRRK
jgi:DNA replication protein DnaC